MVKEKRKIADLYVGDFIFYNGEVCIIIEKSITNSSIKVLSQKGQTHLIVNNDIEIEIGTGKGISFSLSAINLSIKYTKV